MFQILLLGKSEKWKLLSHVRLFETPWTIQPMEFSRPEYWSGYLSLLQGISPTQGSNPGLSHCRQILYQLSHQGCPRIQEWVAYSFSSRSSQPRYWTGVSYRKTGEKNAESLGGHKIEATCILVSNRYSMYYLLFIIPVTVFVVVLFFPDQLYWWLWFTVHSNGPSIIATLEVLWFKCTSCWKQAGIMSFSSYFTLPVD